ncbi:hypothetical protein BDA99DRAFT_555303 [Phascolomyces articulosus]|uniref:Uncharacterized protein n=1 Tax=Phascolomyces articulosus TaxID=60185 RepID=A0AAD5PIF1_9FUNG|nr:hypothetical protein BDA99DRAFT_555303 [Phascolomyces articulosus]
MDLTTTLNTTPPYEQQQSQHHHHQARHHDYKSHPSAFHPVSMPSPPELLHDSEEDEEDSMGSATPSLPHLGDFVPLSRKSVPHRSPPAVKDAIQASALDKSVVFQLDVRSHPFFPAATTASTTATTPQHKHKQQSHDHKSVKCPDCNLTHCCGMACTSRVICGESLLTALRKRVVEARSTSTSSNSYNHHHKRRRMPMQRTRPMIRKTTHIDIPSKSTTIDRSKLLYHHHRSTTTSSIITDQDQDDMSYSEEEEDHHHQSLSLDHDDAREDYDYEPEIPSFPAQQQQQPIRQVRHHRPWLEEEDESMIEQQVLQQQQPQAPVVQKPTQTPSRKRSRPETPPTSNKSTHSSATHHHASSGRPSRVKGPCQACQESSDGCMRKAFNWPFPTSSIYNDKGKKFVYLCNKCGLRYNKSGGCVCRHCRWVFCKEEKRKAMQHIEQMIRSRPDGKVDPDEDIENFVCTPKYWTCGRPWKVGWVLQNMGVVAVGALTVIPFGSIWRDTEKNISSASCSILEISWHKIRFFGSNISERI